VKEAKIKKLSVAAAAAALTVATAAAAHDTTTVVRVGRAMIVDARAEFRLGRLTAFAYARNLFDKIRAARAIRQFVSDGRGPTHGRRRYRKLVLAL
jgi:hypothetical protein